MSDRPHSASVNCVPATGRALPHKVVLPDETRASNLKSDPPSFVTIQVGADDIKFDGCLKAVLGLPAQRGAENCTVKKRGQYQLSDRVIKELASLRTGLTGIIDTVHRDAPGARIVVLDYYQIIPQADEVLSGSTPLCQKLRRSPVGGDYRMSIRAQADAIQKGLNDTIEDVASHYTGVQLIKLDTFFAHHEMCTSDRWLFDETWRAAHPNEKGHRQIADAVLSILP